VIATVIGILSWQAGNDATPTVWTATGTIDTTAKLTSQSWGTDIQLRMAKLPPGQHCKLIVHSRDGTTELAGWWATPTTYRADVPASTSIPLDNIDHLDVVTAGGTVLSTMSPASGDSPAVVGEVLA
jgi:hypothetical protein